MKRLPAWRHRRRQRVTGTGYTIGVTVAEMVRVALAIPAAAPDWLSQCTYYACRSKRAALLVSVLTGLDPADGAAVNRAAEALWDALEHCPITYARAVEP